MRDQLKRWNASDRRRCSRCCSLCSPHASMLRAACISGDVFLCSWSWVMQAHCALPCARTQDASTPALIPPLHEVAVAVVSTPIVEPALAKAKSTWNNYLLEASHFVGKQLSAGKKQ